MTDKLCGTCQSFDRKTRECTNPPNSHFNVTAAHGACSAHLDVGLKLADIVRKFVKDNGISCPEVIHQTDWVIENAYSFIEELCDVVGYEEDEEDAAS